MKHTLLTTLFGLLALLSFSQAKPDSSVHLSFKGIPINGPIEEFIFELKKAGFNEQTSEQNTATLRGDFAGFQNCFVGINTLKGSSNVSSVVVILQPQLTWSSLSENYFTLKNLLTEKYGAPFESKEEFTSKVPNSDELKFFYAQRNECKYRTIFKVTGGSITLAINAGKNRDCYVTLTYLDNANGLLERKKAIDDL